MKKMTFALLGILLGATTLLAEAINMTDTRPCGVPKGWEAFGKGGSCRYENDLLRITDRESKFEWGIRKVIPISQPGRYTFTMEVALPDQATDSGNLKLVLMAGNKTGSIGYLNQAKNDSFTKISSTIDLPEKTSKLTVYISGSFNETGDYYIRKANFTQAGKR